MSIHFMANFTETPVKPNDRKVDYDIITKIISWKDFLASHLITVLYKDFITGGEDYNIPRCVMESTNEYKVETDYLQEWFNENMLVTDKKEDVMSGPSFTSHLQRRFADTIPTRKFPVKGRQAAIGQDPKSHVRQDTTRLRKRTVFGWIGVKFRNL